MALLVLALGAALAVGNLLALIRPREMHEVGEDELERPPLARSVLMIGIGVVATVWALLSLVTAADDGPTVEADAIPAAAVADPSWG